MSDQLIKLPFSDQEYASRVEKVRRQMDEHRLDLLLLTVRENTYYLTGFQGINPTFQARRLVDQPCRNAVHDG